MAVSAAVISLGHLERFGHNRGFRGLASIRVSPSTVAPTTTITITTTTTTTIIVSGATAVASAATDCAPADCVVIPARGNRGGIHTTYFLSCVRRALIKNDESQISFVASLRARLAAFKACPTSCAERTSGWNRTQLRTVVPPSDPAVSCVTHQHTHVANF